MDKLQQIGLHYKKNKKDFNYNSIGEYFEDDLGTLIDNYIMDSKKYYYVNEEGELFFEDNDRMDRYYDTALANLLYLLKKTYNSPKLACKTTGKKDTRLKHVYLNDKGTKLFSEIFDVQKKRIYNALLTSSSKEVINFNNVLNKIINEKI